LGLALRTSHCGPRIVVPIRSGRVVVEHQGLVLLGIFACEAVHTSSNSTMTTICAITTPADAIPAGAIEIYPSLSRCVPHPPLLQPVAFCYWSTGV
jgi:hypothetical protein